ncbi:MAG: 16S rRNA (cytosine(1402)-N(4))-methyltransferase RsmH [Parafilimonas sp.]
MAGKKNNDDYESANPHSKFHIPNSFYHVPVLLHEAIDALQIKPHGTYVDCTYGGGGHSIEILKRLNVHGRLIAFDQDADAQRNLLQDERLIFVPHNFRHLQRFLRLHKFSSVDGILADLGVSSHLFNEGERGFSTRFNGPLDMRMNQRLQTTAADILLTYPEMQLHKLFEQYGEVTNAKTLARRISEHRTKAFLKTIDSFTALLQPVIKGNPHKYLAQVFQALRIEVNDEINALKEMLQQALPVLKTEARIAIITFHSVEDRLVKNFFKQGSFDYEANNHPFETTINPNPLKTITKKPIVSSAEEVKKNPRSRSAKLRVAEKV